MPRSSSRSRSRERPSDVKRSRYSDSSSRRRDGEYQDRRREPDRRDRDRERERDGDRDRYSRDDRDRYGARTGGRDDWRREDRGDRRDRDRDRDRERDRTSNYKEDERDRKITPSSSVNRTRDIQSVGASPPKLSVPTPSTSEIHPPPPPPPPPSSFPSGRSTHLPPLASSNGLQSPFSINDARASPAPSKPAAGSATPAVPLTAEEEKQKQKRERMEAWKKAQAEKKKAEEAKAKAALVAASMGSKVATSTSTATAATGAGTVLGGSIRLAGNGVTAPTTTKTSFGLPTSTLSRIGLPIKPSFLAQSKAVSVSMDDTDNSSRKLQKLSLPPIAPLLAPGVEVESVGGNLEEIEDDDEEEDGMEVDQSTIIANKRSTRISRFSDGPASVPTPMEITPSTNADDDDDEDDPLDAFMKQNTREVKKVDEEDVKRFGISAEIVEKGGIAPAGKLVPLPLDMEGMDGLGTDGNEDDERERPEGEISGEMTAEQILAMAAKKARKKDLPAPDHAAIDYEPFRKAFYVPSSDLDELDEEDVELMRIEMDGIKVRGKDCPKPVTHWGAFGLPAGCYDVIKRLGYEKPTPIQAQAIPAIMSGRDIIGVAKTGSGKTIAFLLPLFRHIKDQRPLENGEGPMAIIMTPTRELATQIWRESKPFMAALGMRAMCAYGGSPLSDQIADMKKGADIVVCTPGRMIDLLTANSGRVTNLRRITYLVLDEADRMFDMGFEPQVMKIINSVRPDRQTLLFSATFPQKMDALARKVLTKPLEITVGSRSVVAKEIDQRVEVRAGETKWIRLLEILGDMGEMHKDEADDFRTLIFVERQESADELFQNLLQKGYICASLHGGKDQVDRSQTISDFKAGFVPIVIATSVAARGLDVKELKLVINYDCPNHMEDYVHRAGRTGRAGNKGTCITFITPEQDKFSLDVVRALKASDAYVSPELDKMANDFLAKVKTGKAKTAGSGFGGKGLDKFEEERENKDRAQRSAYGEETTKDEKANETALVKLSEPAKRVKESSHHGPAPESSSGGGGGGGGGGGDVDYTFSNFKVEIVHGPAPERVAAANARASAKQQQQQQTNAFAGKDLASLPPQTLAALKKAEAEGKGGNVMENLQSAVAKITASLNKTKAEKASAAANPSAPIKKDIDATEYHAIVPINDYPQKARWKATNKEQMVLLQELSGASITNKGLFYAPGVEPGVGQEPKLYLLIESNDEYRVRAAVDELRRILVETSVSVLQHADRDPVPAGRYRV